MRALLPKTMSHIALVGILACLTGCSTTRDERSSKAARSMKELGDVLIAGQGQLDRLQEATRDLTHAKPEDLRTAYERFANQSAAARDTADEARGEARAMKKNTKAYFSAWEKELDEISNGELKKMSRERRALLESEYGSISAAMLELERAYDAYARELADIEKFMGNDLTKVGSELARPFLGRLPGEAERVRRALGRAQNALSHLHDVLKPR